MISSEKVIGKGVRAMHEYLRLLRRALMQALEHDVLATAKSAAYSGMLMLFPALLVISTLLAQAPAGQTLVGELRAACEQFFPADTMQLLQYSFQSRRMHSIQLMSSATTLSVFAALGLMLSLMEGFRKAYRHKKDSWGFWARRIRAVQLLPIALIPFSLATLIVLFGRQYEIWMIANAGHELRWLVLFFWRMVRWLLAAGTSVAVLSSIYHFGTQQKEHWKNVLPGALTATFLWFPVTLLFSWYVNRVAAYSLVYGSLGASIATMVWLYISSFSFLLGAEFNGALYRERNGDITAS
jgi:membrane protein